MEAKHVVGAVVLLIATAIFQDELKKQLRKFGMG